MARRTGFQVYPVDGLLVADASRTITGDDSGDQAGSPITAVRGVELGYAEITADYGSAALVGTEADVTGLSVTVDCDGVTPIELEFHGLFQKQANAGAIFFYIAEGETKLVTTGFSTLIANDYGTVTAKRRVVPTEGEHTYKVRMAMTSTGGRIDADTASPAYLSVVSR